MHTPERFTLDSGTDIPLLWYRGQPVLTFALIDRVHQRPKGTASRNFTEHHNKFLAGEDFHLVDFSQNNEFRCYGIEVPPRGLTVVTESGYLMLVKSFTDDLAWQVQRQLVNGYFRARRLEAAAPEQPAALPNLFPGVDQLPTARLDAALLRELRLISPPLAQVYLVEMGITPDYVSGVLERAGIPFASSPALGSDAGSKPSRAAPLDYLRERVERMADYTTGSAWMFLPAKWDALCQPYDARDTLVSLRDAGYLMCAPNRFTSQGPRVRHGRRKAVFAVLKSLGAHTVTPPADTTDPAPSTAAAE